MLFPPESLNDGKISVYAYQNVYRSNEGTYLQIKVFKTNGYNWVWQVPDVFSSPTEALQYAKQWIHIFKLRRTTP
jgi:hypothetical protein